MSIDDSMQFFPLGVSGARVYVFGVSAFPPDHRRRAPPPRDLWLARAPAFVATVLRRAVAARTGPDTATERRGYRQKRRSEKARSFEPCSKAFLVCL